MDRLLVTGFEDWRRPESVYSFNPSGVVAERLDGQEFEGLRIDGHILTGTTMEALRDEVRNILLSNRYACVVGLGVAACNGLEIEKIGRNVYNTSLDRGRSNARKSIPIIEDGPGHFRTTADVAAIARMVCRETGLPVRPSSNAGQNTCNAIFYSMLSVYPGALFVHTPYSTELVERIQATYQGWLADDHKVQSKLPKSIFQVPVASMEVMVRATIKVALHQQQARLR